VSFLFFDSTQGIPKCSQSILYDHGVKKMMHLKEAKHQFYQRVHERGTSSHDTPAPEALLMMSSNRFVGDECR